MKIAIVGHGFVGKAVDYAIQHPQVEKMIIDPHYGNSVKDLSEFGPEFTFVSVPTPMGKKGQIDCSIVYDVMNYLKQNTTGQLVIKSTIVPKDIKKLTSGFRKENIIYNPEFLTEKNANEDFINPSMHIFGGSIKATNNLQNFYHDYTICTPCPTIHCTPEEASFIKYGINCFLASKVAWFNQFYDIIEKSGQNWNTIVNAIGSDERIGHSHTRVPGYDSKRGYGGACFPKDTAAFAQYAKTFSILESVIAINNEYREVYDKDDREIEQKVEYK